MEIPFAVGGEDLEQRADMVLLFKSYESINPENIGDLAVLAKRLWNDAGVKETFRRRSEFQVADSVGYFLDNLDRISRREYEPTHQDILYARRTTKEVTEFRIPINNLNFVFVDVGGQRSQREKWFKLFCQDMAGTLFMVSASEFDQQLMEDKNENRLKESAIVFRTLINNLAFRHTTFILFLNKMDLLEEKVTEKRTKISSIFEEFDEIENVNKVLFHTGIHFNGNPFNQEDVKHFVLSLFLSQISSSSEQTFKKSIYHHFTIATNTENIRLVFHSVKDSILRKNLDELMLSIDGESQTEIFSYMRQVCDHVSNGHTVCLKNFLHVF